MWGKYTWTKPDAGSLGHTLNNSDLVIRREDGRKILIWEMETESPERRLTETQLRDAQIITR